MKDIRMKTLAVLFCLMIISVLVTSKYIESNRIVGGHNVDINLHPHQVSLRRKSCNNCPYDYVCGGSMIGNNQIVLTAAHCVYKTVQDKWIVVAGTDNRNGSDGKIARIKRIIIHENYIAKTLDNDIALLVLSTPMPLNGTNIKIIEVASEEPKTNAFATISGWGLTTENGVPSQKLQEANVKILDIMACKRTYGDRLHANMLCAGTLTGETDTCNNDSGGPLVSQRKLVGIISWGLGCARPNYPSVYTNAAYFKHWIDYTIQKNMK